MKYRNMKVFDVTDMPDEASEIFYDRFECGIDDDCIDNKWLIDNGARRGELVIVKYWW